MGKPTSVAVAVAAPPPKNHARLVDRVEGLRARVGAEIVPIGVAPLPDGPQLFRQPAPANWDWLVLRLVDDPLFQTKQLAMPTEVRTHLHQLDAAGVVFDELLIAHEVSRESIASTKPTVDEAAAALTATPTKTSWQQRALTSVMTAMGIAAVGLAAAPLAPLALLGGLADPVLIGALTDDGTNAPGTTAALFMIARW